MLTDPRERRRGAMQARTVRAVATGALAVAFTVLSGAAATGSVGKPGIQRVPPSADVFFHDDSCPFPVRQDFQARQGIVQVFFDAAGEPRTIHVAGAFTGTLTHVLPDGSDGPSMRVNFSGPGNIDPDTGLLSTKGPWLLVGSDDPTTPEFDGLMLLVRGQAELSLNPNTGGPIVDATTGNVIDLCAALA